MSAAFQAAVSSSPTSTTKKTARETRIDEAFDAWMRDLNAERGGHVPSWTADLRAAMWGRFAHECKVLIRSSGVPAPESSWDIENLSPNLPPDYRKFARRLMKLMAEPAMVAVGGPRGTGKSTLAWGIVVKFCDCGRRAIYTTAAEFFHELTNAKWEDKQAVRDRMFTPDLLVLDEVHVRDADRQFQDNELTTLIDRRYREHKATLLMSNLTPAALQANVGDSIWRRLVETGGLPIELKGNVHDWMKAAREAAIAGKK